MATKQFTPRSHNTQNLAGRQFGKLTAIELADGPVGVALWRCKCACGNECMVRATNLRTGNSTSCGCSRKTHGASKTLAFSSWKAMMDRCYAPRTNRYARYGGRGITVCVRWHDFANFLADMGERPSRSHSLDRVNNDGNYEPENCRWASRQEQNDNRPGIHKVTFRGETLTVQGWATRLGINYRTLYHRLFMRGWDVEKALTEQVD